MADWWETEEFDTQAAPAEGETAEWYESEEFADAPGEPAPPPPDPAPEQVEDREERHIAPGVWSKRSLGEIITGGAENVAMIGSAALAEPVSGLVGLAGAALPGEPGQGARWAEGTQEALTYTPRGEAGQEYSEDLATFLEPVGEAAEAVSGGLGRATMAATGSPGLATAAHTAPTALVEALGLGILRKPSKAAQAAIDAQKRVRTRPGMTADEVAEAMIEPEEMGYQELTERLKAGELKQVAEQVRPDRQIMADAELLGVDLNPSHYSTNEAYRRVEQAIKSQPGTHLAAREAEAIEQLGRKADEVIQEFRGDIDRSLLDEAVGSRIQGTINELGDMAEQTYRRVKDKIPPATKVMARASRAYLDQRIKDLGGDVSGLTAPEKALHQVFKSDRPPTYARLDQLRRDVGAGYKRQGVFKDEVSGNLDQVYKALITDQQGVADALGVGEEFAAGRKLVQSRKQLEEQSLKLMGRDLNKSILPKLTQAARGLTKGDVQKFRDLMGALPADMRPRAAATMLNDLFTHGARTKTSIGQGFARAYDALERNSGAKAELFKHLPKEAQRRFDALGRVSQGIYRAKALENTSRTARDILQALESATMADKLLKGGGTVGRWVPGVPQAIGDAAGMAAKRQARRAEKADRLMSSPSFTKAINLAMEGRMKEANILLKRSKAWQAWRSAVGEGTKAQLAAVGPIAWLIDQGEPQQQEPAPPGTVRPAAGEAMPVGQ